MSAHTPGPWTSETRMGARTVMHGQFTVAHVDTVCNARLIAAAPDMAAALQEALQHLKALTTPSVSRIRITEAARAALAKAGL